MPRDPRLRIPLSVAAWIAVHRWCCRVGGWLWRRRLYHLSRLAHLPEAVLGLILGRVSPGLLVWDPRTGAGRLPVRYCLGR
jgi:hypothetical protein